MTNAERIRAMSSKELARFLENLTKASTKFRYVEIEKWLDSQNSALIIKGGRAVYTKEQGSFIPCHVLNSDVGENKKYMEIIYKRPAAPPGEEDSYVIETVPTERVFLEDFIDQTFRALSVGKSEDFAAISQPTPNIEQMVRESLEDESDTDAE